MSDSKVSICNSLSEIDESSWDVWVNPIIPSPGMHFLFGLEQHGCLEPFGWHPVYFLIYEGVGTSSRATLLYQDQFLWRTRI